MCIRDRCYTKDAMVSVPGNDLIAKPPTQTLPIDLETLGCVLATPGVDAGVVDAGAAPVDAAVDAAIDAAP